MPCNYCEPNVQLLSGYSPHLISNLQINNAFIPYLKIKNILDGPQYQVLDNYIIRVIHNLPSYHVEISQNKPGVISEICLDMYLDVCNV